MNYPDQKEYTPLYTEEELVENNNNQENVVGNYASLKAVTQMATGQSFVNEDISFDQTVNDAWDIVSKENDTIDMGIADQSIANKSHPVFEETLKQMEERNKLRRNENLTQYEATRKKLQEISRTAVENYIALSPKITQNNPVEQVAQVTEVVSKEISAKTTLERAMEDVFKGLTPYKGVGAILLPTSMFEGLAMERVATKYGIAPDEFDWSTGQTTTRDLLQIKFSQLPDDQKEEWLAGLYDDLKASMLVSDFRAAIMIGEVAGSEDSNWDGFFDFADKIGGVATAVGLGRALVRGSKNISMAKKISDNAATLAKAGKKDATVTIEAVKLQQELARKIQREGIKEIALEATGVSQVIDLTKLITLNAFRKSADTITTATDNLQDIIKNDTTKLIDELQAVVTAKGVGSEEVAEQLRILKGTFSDATNPHIQSVDNFELSVDGTTLSTRVYYKPKDASSFATEKAAQQYIESLDPEKTRGMKIVPDTSNNSFFVEEAVEINLRQQRQAVEAQIAEQLAKLSDEITPLGRATEVDIDVLKLPKFTDKFKNLNKIDSVVTSFKTGQKYIVNTTNDVDKAAIIANRGSEGADVARAFLTEKMGWSDKDITDYLSFINTKLVEKIKTNPVDNTINLETYASPPTATMGIKRTLGLRARGFLDNIDDSETVGRLTIGKGIKNSAYGKDTINFMNTLGDSLGLGDRRVVVLTMDDLNTGAKNGNDVLQAVKTSADKYVGNAAGLHFNYGHDTSVIIMADVSFATRGRYMETFAHEIGHAFEAHFTAQHFSTIHKAFTDWLKKKKVSFTGTGTQMKIMDEIPIEAMLEHRGIMSAYQMQKWVERYLNGDKAAYLTREKAIHDWMTSYSEFFAENFAKWAFTDKVPTTILGEFFAHLVEKFKNLAVNVSEYLKTIGLNVSVGDVDRRIARMLNQHVKNHAKMVADIPAQRSAMLELTDTLPSRSIESLKEQLDAIDEELAAIDSAKRGLHSGYLVEQRVEKVVTYKDIGGYTDADIDSAVRWALGDWSRTTSEQQYAERVTGVHQGSRYTKLLTEYIRPSVEKLSKTEKTALDNVLVLGDKEGKVFSETELAGNNLSKSTREAYYRIRALRDILWTMRNETAAKSLTRRGYKQIDLGIKFDGDVDAKFFGREIKTPSKGSYIYDVSEGDTRVITDEFIEEAKNKGYVFIESQTKQKLGGTNRQVFAIKQTDVKQSAVENVIPYREGEYRRIYSDEYFVKIISDDIVDGKNVTNTITHRTAMSAHEAEKYVKALKEANTLHKAGALDVTKAEELMQAYGWKGQDLIDAFDNKDLGDNIRDIVVKYNRSEDDYVNETINIANDFYQSRGDRVLSIHGEDTVNTLSPLDSIASEISNTAYVTSVNEWRESTVYRWFKTFKAILPADVQRMGANEAFAYMLNNKGRYVGNDKRVATAQRVQDYLVSQLNISTKEEKNAIGVARVISENYLEKLGIKTGASDSKVAKAGVFLRKTKDYDQFMRTVAFHSYFAFNPVQLFMQGMNAFNAVAISPLHGARSAKTASLYGLALFSDQPEIWEKIAVLNKVSSLGTSVEEFVESVRMIKRSGLLDSLNTASLYGANTGKYGIFNGFWRKTGAVSGATFNLGESISRIVSFEIARREYKTANVGNAWWSDDALVSVLKRQDDLTQNMTSANRTFMQRGALSIPFQFMQYPINMAIHVIQALKGSKRGFTQKEVLSLLVMHGLFMGTSGNFTYPFDNEIKDVMSEVLGRDMTDEESLYLQQGLMSGLIGSFTEGEARLALGSRFNTFKYYQDFIKSVFFNPDDTTALDILMGPSGPAALRILGGFGRAYDIIVPSPLDAETLSLGLKEIGASSLSALSNLEKMRIAQKGYNRVYSGKGTPLYDVTDMETYFIGMGIPVAKQEDLTIRYESQKEYTKSLKEHADEVARLWLLANTSDDEAALRYRAAIQVILDSHKDDLSAYKQLLRILFKHKNMTKLQELMADQMMKDIPITEILSEGNK